MSGFRISNGATTRGIVAKAVKALVVTDNEITDVGSDGIKVQTSDTDGASIDKINAEIASNNILDVSDVEIEIYFSDFDDISLIFGGNFMSGASFGVEIDREGAAFDDGVFGNNLISGGDGGDFSINDVNGTVLINGAEEPLSPIRRKVVSKYFEWHPASWMRKFAAIRPHLFQLVLLAPLLAQLVPIGESGTVKFPTRPVER